MTGVIREATWYAGGGRRVRGVWQPARRRSVLLSRDWEVVGARRLLFPDMMILSLELATSALGVGERWEPAGFPDLDDAGSTVMVVGLDGPPLSTGARVYGVGLPSHFDNGSVCLGESDEDQRAADARAGPDGWVERSYWSTSYGQEVFEEEYESLTHDAVVGRRCVPMRLSRQLRPRPGLLSRLVRQRDVFDTFESPTIDDAAYVVANHDYETPWREKWYRRLELKHALETPS